MNRFGLFLLVGAALVVPARSFAANPFAGRWDMTITTPTSTYPGWMELTETDGSEEVRVQPRAGSVFPVKNVKLEGTHLLLGLYSGSGNRPAMSWDLTESGGKLSGVVKRGDEVAGQIAGVRAPALNRPMPKAWTSPESLFDGKDLSGWEPIGNPANNHWVAKDGVLVNEAKGANIRTTRKFEDFKLHVELNCPDRGNSGIYLRGRYEVQVEYEPAGVEDTYHRMGAVYGMVPVTADVPRKPGEWETFDITLVGRRVTVVRDGVKVIDNQEIAGITGGALDSNEAEPGPFYIQGDHTPGIKFRNITISVPKR